MATLCGSAGTGTLADRRTTAQAIKVKAIAIMTLVGGICISDGRLGLVSGLVTCLVCPCTAFLKIPSFV